MRKRRESAEFSMSFLDVICCGFGAVILLLMITKTVQPQIIEASTTKLEGRIAKLQETLFELRGETTILNRDLNARREQLSEYQDRIARMTGALASARSRYDSLQVEDTSNEVIVDRLAIARQSLTIEMERLLANRQVTTQLIGGIPVDSEYVIFVIDTSGSMRSTPAWPRMIQEMESVLNIYPDLKGVQILSDMGNYMFSRYRGQWIPDTAGRRNAIIQSLRNWNVFSNSSPAEGLVQAIRTYGGDGKKVSIFVLGDDFTGNSLAEVLNTVDQLNARSASGERLVRIHAVGFPIMYTAPPAQQGSVHRFAALMRELTYRNGGTFVGLNDFRP